MLVSRRTSPTTEHTTSSGTLESKRPFFSSPGQARPKRRSSPLRARMMPHHSPIMNWMSSKAQGACPTDVVPKILAFCGPQTVARLSQTNRHWRDLCLAESTWRILCEDLYKWSEGDQAPFSWRRYYQENPCVPIDFPTIPAALATVQVTDNNNVVEQRRTIRVLLRPGDYILREAICIQATENVQVTIETMKGPFFYVNHQVADEERTPEAPQRRFVRKAASLRDRLGCRSATQHVEIVDAEVDHFQPVERLSSSRPPCDVATLILRTRRHNEPIIRVRQGAVKLINLEILHNSHGIDIWNGNSAIQIQPPVISLEVPASTIPLAAWLESVEVVSHSGRGIVNIDGGIAVIKNCYVHDCAATGIYVGGPGSQALIEGTDVLHNGNGSRNRRGVGRGHSGVYLEQGKASIRDCNISRNSLTGISAVSAHNSVLDLEASDLVANGAAQLEVPHGVFAESHNMEFMRNNRLAAIGFSRQRSGLVHDDQQQPNRVVQEAMGI